MYMNVDIVFTSTQFTAKVTVCDSLLFKSIVFQTFTKALSLFPRQLGNAENCKGSLSHRRSRGGSDPKLRTMEIQKENCLPMAFLLIESWACLKEYAPARVLLTTAIYPMCIARRHIGRLFWEINLYIVCMLQVAAYPNIFMIQRAG